MGLNDGAVIADPPVIEEADVPGFSPPIEDAV
jgi:hypothetical protein